MLPPSVRIPAFPIDDTMRATFSAALLGGALLLSGCGIKGPLYMPQIPAAPAKPAPSSGADHSKAPSAPADSR